MATLADLRAVSFGLRPELSVLQTLEIEDQPLGGGNFGQNYVCQSVNSAPSPLPLVIKILQDDGNGSLRHGSETLQKLGERLRDLDTRCQRRGEPPLRDVPALLAVPQFYFEARLRGQDVCGYGALRLDTLGYVSFDTFTDGDADVMQDYLALPVADRIRMAYDLADGFRLLEEIGFVHGDINPPNLFVHLAEGHLAIIDFDSGAVVENPGDQPATWGKPGDWLAPEVTAQLAGPPGKPIIVDCRSDAWAVGIGIHYLLFLHHPLVYLSDFGSGTLQSYFAAHLWPEIAPQDALYNAANDAVYRHYRQELPTLPTPIQNALDVLLNTGTFAPDRRPDGAAWARALGATQQPPVISFFDADALMIPMGASVTLTWQVDHAHKLWLSGVGDVTGQSSAMVAPLRSMRYTLTAYGAFGQAAESTPVVRVIPGPTLGPIPVPPPPKLPTLRANAPKAPNGQGGPLPLCALRALRFTRMSQSPVVPGINPLGRPMAALLPRLRLPLLRLPRGPLPGLLWRLYRP